MLKIQDIIKTYTYLAIVMLFFPVCLYSSDNGKERTFNEVLKELIEDFSFDLKTAKIPQDGTISIRKVFINDPIPSPYKRYISVQVDRSLNKYSRFRVIECPTCHVKKSVVKDNVITTTVASNNLYELNRLAQSLGIEAWLDVGVIYSQTEMILSLNAYDTSTKQLLWAKAYNSKNIVKKMNDREIFHELISEDKSPSHLVAALSLGYFFVPNVTRSVHTLYAGLRLGEKFNYNRSEIGATFLGFVRDAKLTGRYPAGDDVSFVPNVKKTDSDYEQIKPFDFGFTILGNYYHYFMSVPENVEMARYGMHVDCGAVVSKGYISLIAGGGLIVKFGENWFLEGGAYYSAPTNIHIDSDLKYRTQGGFSGNVGFGYFF